MPQSSKPLLDQRWPWLTAALAIILAFFASLFIEIDLDPGARSRVQLGTPDDIVGLRESHRI